MNKLLVSLVLLGLLSQTFALYGANSKVVKLTTANFQERVIKSKELWLVEFYGKYILNIRFFY
jgi:hypothetical protein